MTQLPDRHFRSAILPLALLVLVSTAGVNAGDAGDSRQDKPTTSTVTAVEIEELMDYNRTVTLTEEQQEVWEAALSAIPAPCCSTFTAATCCCQCNMARAIWGLAKHLIVDEGADAAGVESEVRKWIVDSHPNGYSGQACFKAACGKALAEDGCGGMNEKKLVF